MPFVTVLPDNRILEAFPGQTLHALLAAEGLLDAPCGGSGTCGKCRVVIDGREVLACKTVIHSDLTVILPCPTATLKAAAAVPGRRAAFDIGTTTVVCYLLDAKGTVLSHASTQNPQISYGADVISRLRAALGGHRQTLTQQIRRAMTALLQEICSTPEEIEIISVVGNPTMQQLFLGLTVDNLVQVPFSPVLCKPSVLSAAPLLPICPKASILTVPDISGYVGADTVAGILSCGIHEANSLTLLVDIGTNGEMVLGNQKQMLACSTAAGPALEGAGISFGMRAAPGAIDRVWLEKGKLCCHVIGDGEATGICGSGLLDAVAAALDLGLVNHRGRIHRADKIMLTDSVYLTQEDIRQVMLAKGSIRAGIERMAVEMSIRLADIDAVVLAGAFGSYLTPESACRIGLLPKELLPKITAVGNAAGAGAVLLASDPAKLAAAEKIVNSTEFLELAAQPQFPKTFAKAMELPEDWLHSAKSFGFTHAFSLDPAALQPRADVRAMCQSNTCRAFGKNWTCPPHCGTLAQCEAEIRSYRHGILLQTVGQLSKDIDSKGYREAEVRHMAQFYQFCDAIRKQYPNALCLGSGGCRICSSCAYPDPCRFPEKALSSMEGYGLFVTQVCKDHGADYCHGPRTVTYSACVLYG